MVCENCFVNKTEKFQKTTFLFQSHQPLVIFLLTVVLNIQQYWKDYWFCIDAKKCLICQIQTVYLNDQYDIYENSLNMDFLSKFHQHLVKNLNRLIEIDCHFVCKVINEKFFYIQKDIFDGNKKHLDLYFCLNKLENKKINQIISNDLKIVI